jgi:hypothetical protein
MSQHRRCITLAIAAVCLVRVPTAGAQAACHTEWPFRGAFHAQRSGGASIDISRLDGSDGVTWNVDTVPALRAIVIGMKPGDVIDGTVTNCTPVPVVVAIRASTVALPGYVRLLALALALTALLLGTHVILPGGLGWLVIGEDNRYSNSKTQAALWFFLLLPTYLSAMALRAFESGAGFVGQVDIPTNLLMLSGISALTFVGAKQITMSKLDASPAIAAKQKPKSVFGPRLRDLVTDDSGVRPDFGDFQMLVVTVVAVVIYAYTVYQWLGSLSLQATVTLPDVDTTLLGIVGVGQGAYLAKKLAGDSGATAAPGPIDSLRPPRPA